MRGVLIFQEVQCPELVREEPETVLRYVYTSGQLHAYAPMRVSGLKTRFPDFKRTIV
jgi:hypothetical protein